MSRPLKRWCSKLLRSLPHKAAGVESRLRGKFECLEARTVLSASFGSMEGGANYESFSLPSDGGPQFSEIGMFAPQGPYHAARADVGPGGRSPGGESFGGRPEFGPYAEMARPEPIRHYYIVYSTRQIQPPPSYQAIQQDPIFDDPFAGNANPQLPVFISSQGPPTSSIGNANAGGTTNAPPSILPPVLASGESLAIATTASSLLSSVASTGRESVAAISAIAHAAAFQDYATQRSLLASTYLTDETDAANDQLDQPVSEADEPDGFLRRSEQSLFDTDWPWTTSIEEERRAVDEVLRRLHDPNALRNGVNSMETADEDYEQGDEPGSIGFNEQPPFDQSQHAADEGMILLQAAGDANESDVNLMSVVDGGLEVADMLLGMEASVGIHQAFDVAGDDELPVSDIAPPVDSSERMPQKDAASGSDTSTLQRAAAAVGATALYGVLQRKRKVRKS